MAKKGISHAPIQSLISGEAVAYGYQNRDDLSGLDKVVNTGLEMGNKAIESGYKNYLLEQQNKQIKAANLQKKKETSSAIIDKVVQKAGGLTDNLYSETFRWGEEMDEKMAKAIDADDKKAEADLWRELDAYDIMIQDKKQFNIDMSTDETGIDIKAYKDPNKLDIINKITSGEVKTTVENGQFTYEIELEDGSIVPVTDKEYQEMVIFKNPKSRTDFIKERTKRLSKSKLDIPTLKASMEDMIPKGNELKSFIANPILDETLRQLLEKDVDGIKAEINGSIFDTDNDPGISDIEFEKFLDVIDDYNHDFWEGDEKKWEKYSREILKDRLSNSIINEHNALYPPPTKKITNISQNNKKPTQQIIGGDGTIINPVTLKDVYVGYPSQQQINADDEIAKAERGEPFEDYLGNNYLPFKKGDRVVGFTVIDPDTGKSIKAMTDEGEVTDTDKVYTLNRIKKDSFGILGGNQPKSRIQ